LTAVPVDPPVDARLDPPRAHSRYYILRLLRDELNGIAREVIPKGGMLIDYGAGSSPYRPIFDPLVRSYVAVDLPARIQPGSETLPIGHASLRDASAAVVLSTQVIEHAEDWQAHLAECRRLLEPGGLLVLSTHGYWLFHPDPADYWRWTRQGLAKVIVDSGFEIVRLRGLMGIAPTGLQLLQDGLAARLPVLLRPAFFWFMQRAIGIVDRIHTDAERDADACVFVVVARSLPS
jgi:SAM-dependent methyltransferase